MESQNSISPTSQYPLKTISTTPVVSKYLLAMEGMPCREIVSLSQSFTKLIFKVFAESGQPVNMDEAETLANSLEKEIKQYFGGLTIAEVEHALELGIRGKYGEYYGLSIKTFHSFLKKYFESKERAEAWKQKQPQLLIDKVELTQEEKDKKSIEGIIFEFENYSKNKNSIVVAVTYDFLERKGILKVPKEKKKEFMIKAEANLKRNYSPENGKLDCKESLYKKYIQEIENKQGGHVINEAKRLLVCEFYDELINIDEHIKHFLK